jgi:hypothetical protein
MAMTIRQTLRRCYMPLVGCLLVASCVTTNYSKVMQKEVKNLLGEDYAKYHYASYPTTNSGVGSGYTLADKDLINLCPPTSCLGIDPNDLKTDDDWLKLKGFVAVQGNGGSIDLTETKEKKAMISAVLPEIYKVVNASADASHESKLKIDINIPQAYPRYLDRTKFNPYIGGLAADNVVKKAYDQNVLVMVTNDVVVSAMSVNICFTDTSNASLKAGLSSNVGKVVGDGASLQASISTSSDGCYRLQIAKPVVVATLQRKKPAAMPLEATNTKMWDSWEPVATVVAPFTTSP